MPETQVDPTHYRFERYCDHARWSSYHEQIRQIVALGPSDMVEIGVGDQVLRSYIEHNTPIRYANVDFDPRLGPDVVGSVADLPLVNRGFDLVACFQVLEHLPFETFEKAVLELVRVARRFIIISLPHYGPAFRFSLKLPLVPLLRLGFKVPVPQKHKWNGQHYWEIGKRHYPERRIRAVLAKHATVAKHFVPFANTYHHFYVLEKSDANA